MPFVQAGEVRLHYVAHGDGRRPVVFVHGNLGCLDWMSLVWPLLPPGLRVYAYDWRGCGGSDKPEPEPGYANYSISAHARDLIAFLDALGLERVDLAVHSTGSIIADRAVLTAPGRFGRILALDPVPPQSLRFDEAAVALFAAMKADPDSAFAGLATAAPTLFRPESLGPGMKPVFRDSASPAQRELFELLVERTRGLSDGIWFGTPARLTLEAESGELAARAAELTPPQRVIWGEFDYWIPRADVERMARALPDCTLSIEAGVGHSMNLEDPRRFAKLFSEFFTVRL